MRQTKLLLCSRIYLFCRSVPKRHQNCCLSASRHALAETTRSSYLDSACSSWTTSPALDLFSSNEERPPSKTDFLVHHKMASLKKTCDFCVRRKRSCDGFARRRCRWALLFSQPRFYTTHLYLWPAADCLAPQQRQRTLA